MDRLYGVYLRGGSIGENNKDYKHVFVDKEEAKEKAKECNKSLSKGEKSYYKMKYYVKELK